MKIFFFVIINKTSKLENLPHLFGLNAEVCAVFWDVNAMRRSYREFYEVHWQRPFIHWYRPRSWSWSFYSHHITGIQITDLTCSLFYCHGTVAKIYNENRYCQTEMSSGAIISNLWRCHETQRSTTTSSVASSCKLLIVSATRHFWYENCMLSADKSNDHLMFTNHVLFKMAEISNGFA